MGGRISRHYCVGDSSVLIPSEWNQLVLRRVFDGFGLMNVWILIVLGGGGDSFRAFGHNPSRCLPFLSWNGGFWPEWPS